jgi:hypothetical protein
MSNIHDPNTTTHSNNNNNHNVLSQHQQPSPQRQLSNPNIGLPSPQMSNDRMWALVKALEDRMGGLEAEVVRLREQVAKSGGESQGANTANGS